MSDLDFPGLRSYVESHTYLPEFTEVERRARRHRHRQRATTVLTAMSVLLIVLPAFVFGTAVLAGRYGAPDQDMLGLAGHGRPDSGGAVTMGGSAPSADPTPSLRTLIAADGVDLQHLYGLIDVCRGRNCSLQIVSITPEGKVLRVGMLRTSPIQALIAPRLVALDSTTVVVSAGVGGATDRQSVTATVAPVAGAPTTTADRPVQISPLGRIQAVRAHHRTLSTIPQQPPVSQPTLASASHGWWVTGTDPNGEIAVSVSHDGGHTWLSRSIGVLADNVTPALATSDGTHVYLTLRSSGQMMLARSTDGGDTWQQPAVMPSWPASTQFGVYVRHNGTIVTWLITTAGTTYLDSLDGGATFTPTVGPVVPSGAVVTLPGGYLTLGENPSISSDGATWTTPFVPSFDVFATN